VGMGSQRTVVKMVRLLGFCAIAGGDVVRLGALRGKTDSLHPVATMAPPRHPLRSYVIALFRHGDLVSVREAVQVCGASRQAVSKWIKSEGINIGARRMSRIAAYATNAQRHLDGLPPVRPPTKRQMRKSLQEAMRRFNEANSRKSILS